MDRAKAYMLKAMELHQPMDAAMARGDSIIQKWYKGSVVFVTGASGFLGKLLIEKLLRSCDIKYIYILMRPKKGKNIKERLNDIINDELFDTLRKKKPGFFEKIIPVEGDVAELKLGLIPSDWETLAAEVDVIFHEAATTRFNEPLKQATLINVRGTREVLELGKACKKLKSMVHVSTGFCHATKDRISSNILEKFYQSPVPPSTIIQLAEGVAEDRLAAITPALIDGWPNTYTFTKAIAEELIRVEGSELPINIVRPSFVTPTYYEPVPGWMDESNIFGPTGIFLGAIMGLVHVIYSKDVNASQVPSDLITNATVVAAWDATLKRDNRQTDNMIFTLSNNKCNFSYGAGIQLLDTKGRPYASPKSVWYNYGFQLSNRFLFWICTWLLHFIPGYMATAIIYLLDVKLPKEIPPIIKVYTKLYNVSLVYSYFLVNEWYLNDDNTEKLFERLPKSDQAIFNFDVRTVDWERHTMLWGLGVRKYLIRDGLEDTEYAVKKQRFFKVLNYILCALCVYVLYCIVYFFFELLIKLF